MRQETFKNMYNRISLSKEQKERIYEEIQATQEEKHAERGVRLTMRTAAFALIFLISGMTVFAFEKFSLAERLAGAMSSYMSSDIDKPQTPLTQEQRDFYEEYGQILGIDIATYYGMLRLEAALYDDNYLIIPYTYTLYTGEDDVDEEKAGISISNIGFFTEVDSANLATWISRYGKIESMEEGVRVGSFVLALDETLSPGEIVKVGKNLMWEYSYDIVLAEFTLGKKVDKVNLAIDEESQKLLREKGLIIDEITMSPLSISVSGFTKPEFSANVYVVFKDGSEMEVPPSSGYNGYGEGTEEGYPNAVGRTSLFSEMIQLDNVEGIRLKTLGVEIWIPMEQSE